MNYKIKYTKQIVYAFVILPIVLLILVAVFVAVRQNIFEKRFNYFTTLKNAVGLSTQTPVLYKGFEIGRVKKFNLLESGMIRVEFYVLKSYNGIMVKQSVIQRVLNPVTSKTTLEYVCKTESKDYLKDGDHILSSDFEDGKRALMAIAPDTVDPISGIIDNILNLTTELNRDNNPDRGALARIMFNVANATGEMQSLMQNLNATLSEVSVLTAKLNRDHNPDDGAVFRILANAADITDSLNQQMGTIASLLKSADQLTGTLTDPDSLIVKMIDPTGQNLIKPLSSTLYALSDNLNATLSLLRSVNTNSPQFEIMINNLNETMTQAKQTLEALNNNPILRKGITPTTTRPASPDGRISEFPND
jgi:ABC-type transporter Mla subunit MlaD